MTKKEKDLRNKLGPAFLKLSGPTLQLLADILAAIHVFESSRGKSLMQVITATPPEPRRGKRKR